MTSSRPPRMELDPRRFRFLLAIARAGGVLAAADELKVTPSAVSQQLGRLEREVGRPLVQRTPTGTVLTPAGVAVVEAAEQVERTLNVVRERLESGDADPVGTVRIGGFQSFLRVIVAPHLRDWRARYPSLRLEIVEDEQPELLRRLRAGELDVVAVELDADERRRLPRGVAEVPLLDEPWLLVTPPGTVAATDVVDLARLTLPWLATEPGSASDQAVRRVRRALGAPQATVHTYLESMTALALVAAGEGMALLPSLALHGLVDQGVDTYVVPGLGTRRIVLRTYERSGASAETMEVATSLLRAAAAGVALDGDEASARTT